MRVCRKLILSATLVAGITLAIAPAAAAPLGFSESSANLSAHLANGLPLIKVRHRRSRNGTAVLTTGALFGNINASQPNFFRGHQIYPSYSAAYPADGPYTPGDPAVVYCMRHYRSFDPSTKSYVGFDGYRRNCR